MRLMEELAMNAWPSLQTMLYDGWIIRLADGYTKRANSVNPLYPSYGDVNDKIAYCEKLFKARGLSPTYKMTASVFPDNLDKALEERGYKAIDHVGVLMMDLSAATKPLIQTVIISDYPKEKWVNEYCRLNHVKEQHKGTLKKMLDSIIPTKHFVSLLCENEIIACGMAVIEHDFAGLFDIVVAEGKRNQGYGKQLMLNLLNIAKSEGAKKAYLQVMLKNLPAFDLYMKLGFKEAYQYWYRVYN